MEIKKNKTLTHLLLSGYTIGFILGSLAYFMAETNFDISLSIESVLCIVILSPIIYWVYRYSGMVFNDQNIKIKLIYSVLFIIGMGLGVIFFELILE